QNPRRVSGGDGEIRDIRRYDGTGADHGMAADANATDNRRIAADASALAYKSAQTSHLAVGGRIEIIGKHDPVSDEYAVLKFDTVAYEGMTFDLASSPDFGTPRDLDKRTDECAVADRASKYVDELWIKDNNSFSQLDIRVDHFVTAPPDRVC